MSTSDPTYSPECRLLLALLAASLPAPEYVHDNSTLVMLGWGDPDFVRPRVALAVSKDTWEWTLATCDDGKKVTIEQAGRPGEPFLGHLTRLVQAD